jgi:chromosome segregation ATPase
VEQLRSTSEKAEDDLQIVNGEYEALNRELDLKDAEITSLERKLDGRGGDGTEMQNLREEIRDLQAQIEQYETEKQELERDARQLIEKDSRVARERNEERSNFQTVMPMLNMLISGH